MNFSQNERPWICLCQKEIRDEWGVILYPSGEIQQIQLGTGKYLSSSQMIKKIKALDNKQDKNVEDGLLLAVSESKKLYWTYPINEEKNKFKYFDLSGEELLSQPK